MTTKKCFAREGVGGLKDRSGSSYAVTLQEIRDGRVEKFSRLLTSFTLFINFTGILVCRCGLRTQQVSGASLLALSLPQLFLTRGEADEIITFSNDIFVEF